MSDAGSRGTPAGIPEITIGTRITNFGVRDITVEGLASGGMGLVAWGPNRARGGQVEAVKLPRPDRLAAASRAQRAAILADFEREALTWCHLWAHPCIISAEGLLRMRALGNLPAIFIEYAPEGSLRDRLNIVHHTGSTKALGLTGVFAWGQMIAAALAAIHQPAPDLDRPEPLVHCDLKPENVLLDERGWAMLTDLGLTRALASLADTASPPDVDVASLSTIIMGATAMGQSSQSDQPDQGNLAGLGALTAEQRAQVAQVRRLLAQAGIAPAATPSPDHAEDALYGTRTICVSPAQQAALTAAMTASVAVEPSAVPAIPALSPSATSMIAQIGSRGQVAGTLQYMPPEQWLGLDAVEPASDVYALGVLLFELFAGVGGRAGYPHTPDPWLLLTAGPYAAWCAAHVNGPSRHLFDAEVCALSDGPLVKLVQEGQQAQAEQVLSGLDALIRDCLAISPAARPTAWQVRERLAILAGLAGVNPLTITENPRTPESEAIFWSNLGITYGEMGQHEGELRLLRRAVGLTPENPQRRETLGNALNELGRAQQEAAEKAAAQGDQAMAQQLGAQARAHLEEGVRTFEAAEADLTPEQLTRYPHLANSLPYNLGGAFADLGRYAEAAAATQRALASDPNDAMAYRQLALIYMRWARESGTSLTQRIERLERAETDMQKALAIAPYYGGGQALLSDIQRALAAARGQ